MDAGAVPGGSVGDEVRNVESGPAVTASLPPRRGPRPRTTPTNPHTQLDQQPETGEQRERLAATVFAFAGVREEASVVSVPGARALCVADPSSAPGDAFLAGSEFAHLHPGADHSLHVMLPPQLAPLAIDAGWAEPHPVASRGLVPPNAVMIYAPRDDGERELVTALVRAAHAYATGAWPAGEAASR